MRSTATRRSGLLLSELKRGYKGREEERPLLARLALHASRTHPSTHPGNHGPAADPGGAAAETRNSEVALKYLRKFGGGTQSLRKR